MVPPWVFPNPTGNVYDPFSISTPTQIGAASEWSNVGTSEFHTIALKTNRTIWSCGWNSNGELGWGSVGFEVFDYQFGQIGADSDWSQVVAGTNDLDIYSLGLKTNGTLWAWGGGIYGVYYGELGLGSISEADTPSAVGNQSDWSKIATGAAATFAIKTNRTLWSWGSNSYGQLGLGYTSYGTGGVGVNTPTQVVGGTSDWSAVSAAGYNGDSDSGYTIAIKTNGSLWGWGYNGSGQLGLGDTIDRWTPSQIGIATDWSMISCGATIAFALKTNRTLWIIGNPLVLVDEGNPPVTPTALTAAAIAYNQVNLSWNKVAIQTSYEIDRASTSGGPWTDIGTTAPDVVSYPDTTVTPSNTYWYKVCAFNASGYSPYSSPPVSATTPAQSPAVKLAFSSQPANTLTGVGFSPPVAVTVQDTYGNTELRANNMITITGVGTTLSGTLSLNAVNGVATFTNVTVGTTIATGCTITAAAAGLTGATSNSFDVASGAVTVTFDYTGGQQTWVVPSGITSISVTAMGAQGGSGGGSGVGGKGAWVQTTLSVTPGQTLYIYVGGQGGTPTAGWNGGGLGANIGLSANFGGGGGGASDIRQGGTALTNRIVVAGGGGGAYNSGVAGGAGGYNGAAGGGSASGGGGTQTLGGAGGSGGGLTGGSGGLGTGGNFGGIQDGGGGAGYYGGGGGGGNANGGGGGSSWTSGTSPTYTSGYRSGNGQIIITY